MRPIVPGYYLVRLVPDGPKVPAEIQFDGFRYAVITNGTLDGEWTPNQAANVWGDTAMDGTAFKHPLLRIVLFGKLVDAATFEHHTALREWAERNAPDHWTLWPYRPIDHTKLESDF
jgi:hypothetical protein